MNWSSNMFRIARSILMVLYLSKGASSIHNDSLDFSGIENPTVRRLTEEFHHYCPQTFLCKVDVPTPDYFTDPDFKLCCHNCYCPNNYGPSCPRDDPCCPDVLDDLVTPEEVEKKLTSTIECVHAQYRPFDPELMNGLSFSMVADCPPTFTDATIRRKCQMDYANIDFMSGRIAEYLPVSENTTGPIVNYRNRHCAICNGLSQADLFQWFPAVKCESAQLLAGSMKAILDAVESTPECNLVFQEPFEFKYEIETCDNVIDRCNVTGTWQAYDQFLELACHSYYTEYSGYKNVHCFLCNGHTEDNVTLMCPEKQKPIAPTSSFIALIDFNDLEKPPGISPVKDEDSGCTGDQVYDAYQKKCQKITCSTMMSMTANRSACVSMYSHVSEINIQLTFALFPGNSSLDMDSSASIGATIRNNTGTILQNLTLGYVDVCNVDTFVKINRTFSDSLSYNDTLEASDILYIGAQVTIQAVDITDVHATFEELLVLFTSMPMIPTMDVLYYDIPASIFHNASIIMTERLYAWDQPDDNWEPPHDNWGPDDNWERPDDNWGPDDNWERPDDNWARPDDTGPPPWEPPDYTGPPPTEPPENTGLPPWDPTDYTESPPREPPEYTGLPPWEPPDYTEPPTRAPSDGSEPPQNDSSSPWTTPGYTGPPPPASPEDGTTSPDDTHWDVPNVSSPPVSSRPTRISKDEVDAITSHTTADSRSTSGSRAPFTEPNDRLSNFIEDPSDGLTIFMLPYTADNPHPCFTRVVRLTPLQFCPKVTLSQVRFSISLATKSISISDIELKLDLDQVIFSADGKEITLCKDVYIQGVSEYLKKQKNETSDFTVQAILSIVCSCLSLICLATTELVYASFRSLRTLPGMNNMALVLCLFVSQSLFLVSSLVEISVPWLCSLVGVLLHFSLLSAFFWMNVCTMHMTKVFLTIETHSSLDRQSLLPTVARYTLLVVVLSTVFIGINITLSLVETDMAEMGYGGQPCYIIRKEMIGYTVAIPLGFVVITDLVMFFIVIYKVKRMPDMQKHTKHERNNVVIFAKLSTITGLTWIFAFIYQWSHVTVFAYLFIVLNASQGVFIMLSFVFNKRVFTLIRGATYTPTDTSNTKSSKTLKTDSSPATGFTTVTAVSSGDGQLK